ncbi:N-acyl homoserine lactonase family protein [Sphingomonas alba]|uniref:N-acyl homoserine lactonase family protein n=1 Tax=Sphingomonas alba TaxID=2908208 RepID=A0ABT0RPG8_9SPHN|nr:N-acyl homoserine lactonase family protein [Sphingomonas alba]MCL6684528.1 N-acyl homoserine lactonase family protein [Sphingomonas alba]
MLRTVGLVALLLAGCTASAPEAANQSSQAEASNILTSAAPASVSLTLTRLDCGHAEFKDMNGFFSDKPGVYPPGPGKVTDSCYLIRHSKDVMVWDTGLPAASKDKPMVQDNMSGGITVTLAYQLAELGIKPTDVTALGISHEHGDHTGQAAQFTNARLIIGKGDFEQLGGKPDDPFLGWRGQGAKVTLATADTDIFGDGSVIALHLPGHTPDHLGLLVKLKSGPVILSGDTYHTQIARENKSVPGFNTDRAESVKSMERLEQIVAETHAKLIIQHEPNDIAKLPVFPKAAE